MVDFEIKLNEDDDDDEEGDDERKAWKCRQGR